MADYGKHRCPIYRVTAIVIYFALVALILPACQSGLPTLNRPRQQLRIVNSGTADVQGLVVLFPGPTADSLAARVAFGDVEPGQTTEYRDVPSGVYRYAAYEYTLKDQKVTQAVVDWIGESPMAGQQFTYRLSRDPQEPPGNQIKLEQVLVDKP